MRKIYVSKYANEALIEYFENNGYNVIFVDSKANVDPYISCHPDIYMCDLGYGNIYHGKPEKLTHDYPGHAIYNACSTGKYFIHNLKITDPELLETAKSHNLIPVHVPQGYAKCSIVVVDEDSIITADQGIFKACTKAGLKVLLIEKGQVILEGYPYGFIGGASGMIRKHDEQQRNVLLFNGDVRRHSDFKEIKEFVEGRGLELKYFEGHPLADIGSIVEEI